MALLDIIGLGDAYRRSRQRRKLIEWVENGMPNPPAHLIKQGVLRQMAQQHDLKVFVETGTCHGDMVDALRGDFGQIYSIELADQLFRAAEKRFAGDNHIRIIQGDSGVEMKNLVDTIDQPTLFWLDGHYSGGTTARGEKDTPIHEELGHIFSSNIPHWVIVIDDARLFDTDPGYPTKLALAEYVHSQRPDASIEVQFDSIRIRP